jgi:hypothetical protein
LQSLIVNVDIMIEIDGITGFVITCLPCAHNKNYTNIIVDQDLKLAAVEIHCLLGYLKEDEGPGGPWVLSLSAEQTSVRSNSEPLLSMHRSILSSASQLL